jgi:hypothetical protein
MIRRRKASAGLVGAALLVAAPGPAAQNAAVRGLSPPRTRVESPSFTR